MGEAGEREAGLGQGSEGLRVFLAEQDVACPNCGYNLRGLTGDRCAECGQHLTVTDLQTAMEEKGTGATILHSVPALALLFVVPGVLGCLVMWRWFKVGYVGKFMSPTTFWIGAAMGGMYLACSVLISVLAVRAWRERNVRRCAVQGRWLVCNVILGVATAVVVVLKP